MSAVLSPPPALGTASKPAEPAAAKPDFFERGADYMFGRNGVAADLGMAAASFLDSADMQDPRGLYAAGMMYLKGVGLSASRESALDHLNRSAATGYEPAKAVLAALKQGNDVAAFPILPKESVVVAAPPAATLAAGGMTPVKILAAIAAVVTVGAVGGYVLYQGQQSKAAAVEQARVAEEDKLRLAAETLAAKTQAEAAIRQVEADRQRLALQQADLETKTEALRQQESQAAAAQAQAQAQADAANAPVVTAAAAPVAAAAASDDYAVVVKQARPRLRSMLEAALAGAPDVVVRESAAIRSLPPAVRGDRKLSRNLNTEGLAALKRDDYARAVTTLNSAALADPADEEVATNQGYALVKAGRYVEAQGALLRALTLNPGRSSAWYNFGLAQLGQNSEQSAYGAFLLTFQFAGNQQKSRDWFERVAADETADPTLRKLAQRLLASPSVVAAVTVPVAPR